MSWDKNTISISEIDAVKHVLDNLGVKYTESIIATFNGRGLNDAYNDVSAYNLRRLQYNDIILLECVEMDADCDIDDVIISYEFSASTEPKNWKAIKHTDKFSEYEAESIMMESDDGEAGISEEIY
jgi:hypothetical protein